MVEIERKFLVEHTGFLADKRGIEIIQGYICVDGCTCRVRIAEGQGLLGLKSATAGAIRSEFEYEIPLKDARELIENFCGQRIVRKTRYKIMHAGHLWEVDRFHDKNEGLILAEIELNREDETFELPAWIGEEVTHDIRYYNASLASGCFHDYPSIALR